MTFSRPTRAAAQTTTSPAIAAARNDSPPATAVPQAPCALKWLSEQDSDIMDICLGHLNGGEQAALSRAWVRVTDAALLPPTRMTERLAAASHRHFAEGIAPGPLRQAVAQGLSAIDDAPYHATHWLRLPQWRDTLLRERDAAHKYCLDVGNYRPIDDVSKDNTSAVMALDRLDGASPCKDASLLRMGFAGPLYLRRQNARIAGFEVLLLASTFSAAMQSTLLAHVIVGIALTYVGQGDKATAVLQEAVDVRLPKAIKLECDRGAHPFYGVLRGHSTSPGQQAMQWLKSAALAADDPYLQKLAQKGSAYLEPLHQFEIFQGLNPRWAHLQSLAPIDHDIYRRWCEDVGHRNFLA